MPPTQKPKHQNEMVFPIGAPNDAFAKYFIGQSYLAPLSTQQVGIYNVTFEPGCRKMEYSIVSVYGVYTV